MERTDNDCWTISNVFINDIPYTIDHIVVTKLRLKSKLKVTGCEIITELVSNARLK
jgi:hypothetical protein